MNPNNIDFWQKNLQESLGEISKSLALLARVQALSCLYEKTELQRLAKMRNLLVFAHAKSVEDLGALSKNETVSNDRDRKLASEQAMAAVKSHHSALRQFDAEHPYIDVLSQFIGQMER